MRQGKRHDQVALRYFALLSRQNSKIRSQLFSLRPYSLDHPCACGARATASTTQRGGQLQHSPAIASQALRGLRCGSATSPAVLCLSTVAKEPGRSTASGRTTRGEVYQPLGSNSSPVPPSRRSAGARERRAASSIVHCPTDLGHRRRGEDHRTQPGSLHEGWAVHAFPVSDSGDLSLDRRLSLRPLLRLAR